MTAPRFASREAWETALSVAVDAFDELLARKGKGLALTMDDYAECFRELFPPPAEDAEKADFFYERDNWEYTWEESDFFDTLTNLDYGRPVLRVGRLKKLPDQWAARVPLGEPDEDGNYEDYEWMLFATEAEARAAAKEKPDA